MTHRPVFGRERMNILVTGATGYVGGKLAPMLVAAGHAVTVLVRDRGGLPAGTWVNDVTIVSGDVRDEASVARAVQGQEAAYYLVHNMQSAGPSFHSADVEAGTIFGSVAARSRTRIVYLGALGDPEAELSEHLRSRHETGRALARAGAHVTELRAGPVIGAGSLPFEMVRYLTERVPVMVCPRWVSTKVQPIGVRDLLAYLVASLDVADDTTSNALQAVRPRHRIIEIGGAEALSYGEMMTRYAQARGLRRVMLHVPVLTPRLSSYWIRLVTPLRAGFAQPVVEGLRNETVVRTVAAQAIFPRITPGGYETAVRTALEYLRPAPCKAVAGEPGRPGRTDICGMIRETRSLTLCAEAEAVFAVFSSLGGSNGWPLGWVWKLRGAFDRLIGGVGMRKTAAQRPLRTGDVVDFWRVEAVEPGRRLLLSAEMKLPGEAWLEFTSKPTNTGSQLTQTAYFAPLGLSGLLYWYVLLPMHAIIFSALLKTIARRAEQASMN